MKKLPKSQWINLLSALAAAIGTILQSLNINFTEEIMQSTINLSLIVLGVAGCYATPAGKVPGLKP
tara:strand:- start:718 stop:915 length:198 start_codon:yes stop_codon:yes gene_type:complete